MQYLRNGFINLSLLLGTVVSSGQPVLAKENLTWQELKLKTYSSQVSMPKPITLNALTDSLISLEAQVTGSTQSLLFIADKLDRGVGGFFNIPIISLKREELLEDVSKKSLKIVLEQFKEMVRKDNGTTNVTEPKFDKNLPCDNGAGKQYSFTIEGIKCLMRSYIILPDNHFQLIVLGADEKDPLAQKFFNSFQSLH